MSNVKDLRIMLQDMKDNELWCSLEEKKAIDDAITAADKGAGFQTVMDIYTGKNKVNFGPESDVGRMM